jgi:hypothetical protein
VTRERLKALLAEYGQVAIYTYFGLFLLVLAGFSAGIAWGADVESTEGGLGVLGAAYLATKATQPLRIAATLGLTPLVAALLHKLNLRKPKSAAPAAGAAPAVGGAQDAPAGRDGRAEVPDANAAAEPPRAD